MSDASARHSQNSGLFSRKERYIYLTANYADILCIVQEDYIIYNSLPEDFHSRNNRRTYLYHNRTGKPLKLDELFHEGTDYLEIINNRIREDITREGLTQHLTFETITDEALFFLSEGHLIFYSLQGGILLDPEYPFFWIPFEAFGESALIFY